MHELGIVFHIADSVRNVAEENRIDKVTAVTLELGEVSGVIHKELISCWDWNAKRYEVLDGAKLNIVTIPAVTWCDSCKSTYPTVQYGRTCPHCGSGETWLQQGNEVIIKDIEVL